MKVCADARREAEAMLEEEGAAGGPIYGYIE